jgi:transketolase
LPQAVGEAVAALKRRLVAEKPSWATRKASHEALAALTAAIPEMIGGSADLTGSNLTHVKTQAQVAPGSFGGSYIHYGVREHGMAAAMNGIALHGGFIPYGGSFLVFTDYCRPSIRLSALMGLRVIYVMTHDSIGLGEDGPTHQPIEQLASLRAMPNLRVFRPADAVETLECWQCALDERDRPSVLALSRQNLPALRFEDGAENLCARGAYVLRPADGGEARVRLLATGSEVALAVAARDELQKDGVPTAVVSMPCWELFAEQPAQYREAVLGRGGVRVAVEAASTFGWERFVGTEGAVIGLARFGASAPYEELYRHFGLTQAAIVAAAKARLQD